MNTHLEFVIAASIMLAVVTSAQPTVTQAREVPEPDNHALFASDYVFTSFRGNGEDGLHLAWSTNGYQCHRCHAPEGG